MSASRKDRARSLRNEIVAGFVALLLSFGVVGGFAVWRQARAVQSLRVQNQGYLSLSFVLGDARATQTVLTTLLERVATESDRAVTRTWMSGARKTRRSVVLRAQSLATDAIAHARDPEDAELLRNTAATLAEIEQTWREDEGVFVQFFDALARSDAAHVREAQSQLIPKELRTADLLRDLSRRIESRMRSLADQAVQEQPRTLRVLVLGTLIALVVGLATLFSVRNALQPLAALIARVRAVASGDMTQRTVRARNDEIGEFAREFDNMVEAVNARDLDLRQKAQQIQDAERHLEQVVATLRSGVMVIENDTIRSANPAAIEYANAESLVGESLSTTAFGAWHTLTEAVRATCEQRAMSTQLGPLSLANRVYEVGVRSFLLTQNDAQGALVVIDDVTEREEARARLLRNERLAAIGRMAAHVTHEVRNPLSSMALNAEMLLDEARAVGEPGAEMARLAVAIQREIDRLTSVTEEYLRVARLPQPRLEPEDPLEIVNEVVAFVRPELQRAGISIEVHAPPTPFTVMLDEAQIRQSLLNLLRNAREAIENGGSAQRAIQVMLAKKDNGLEIAVCDTGPGIRPEVLGNLFELFFTTKERGSGLGLPLTREIVRAHGGDIVASRASEQEGGGARFTISLPIAQTA